MIKIDQSGCGNYNHNGWRRHLEFRAWSICADPGNMIRIAVGHAHNPHRTCWNHNRKHQQYFDQGGNMDFEGWSHRLSFWAYSNPRPGLIRVCVGQAHNPHRFMINHSDKSQAEWNLTSNNMNFAGWTHHMEFYVK